MLYRDTLEVTRVLYTRRAQPTRFCQQGPPHALNATGAAPPPCPPLYHTGRAPPMFCLLQAWWPLWPRAWTPPSYLSWVALRGSQPAWWLW